MKVIRSQSCLAAAHLNIKVFLGGSDVSAPGTVPVLKAGGLPAEARITGQVASASGIAAIRDSMMFGTTGTWPHTEGQAIAKLAVATINGSRAATVNLDGFSLPAHR